MGQKIDLTGKEFGQWKVIREATKSEKQGKPGAYWLCECQCENKTRRIVCGKSLFNGVSKSCGHDTNGFKDLTDMQFGEWKVIRRATYEDVEKYNDILVLESKAYWLCECSCKKIKVVKGNELRLGKTTSCGHDTSAYKDLTGRLFGKWKVLRRASDLDIEQYGTMLIPDTTYWLCECQCEAKTIRIVTRGNLLKGKSTCCGCTRTYDRPLNINRTHRQIENMEKPDKLKEELVKFEKDNCRKPNTRDLISILGVTDMTCALEKIKRCGFCDLVDIQKPGNSIYEIEIAEALGIAKDKYTMHNRKLLAGMEIDIFIPDHRIGIEFNGDFWHSDKYKGQMYHQQKSIIAKNNRIELIHIFEHEYNKVTKREIIMNTIKSKIGSYSREVISISNCSIVPINNVIAADINNKYNIHGHKDATVTYAVKYGDTIVELMSFSRGCEDSIAPWRVIRHTIRYDILAEGGTERLLKYFKEIYKSNVAVYCDVSKDSGSRYREAGLEFIKYTTPDYIWYNEKLDSIIENASNIKIEYTEGNKDNISKEEIVRKMGYNKIYNCGEAIYIMRI